MMVLDKPLIRQLLVNANISIKGISTKKKSFLLQELVEKSLMSIQDINILVRRLSLGDLVKCYNEIPLTSPLSSAIDYRLTQLNYLEWSKIIRLRSISLLFLEKYSQYVDWDDVSKVFKFTLDEMVRLETKLNFKNLSKYQQLSDQTILRFALKWDWRQLCMHQTLSEAVISQCMHLVCPITLLKYQSLSEQLIRQILRITPIIDSFECLSLIVKYQTLTHDFIQEYYKHIPMLVLIKYQKLQSVTLSFIARKLMQETYITDHWKHEIFQNIVTSQDVSIEFCEEFMAFIDFNRLVRSKPLSEELLYYFRYKFDWRLVIQYQKLSTQFLDSIPKPFTRVIELIESDNDICSICLDSYKEAVQLNPCNHIFCLSCIDETLHYNPKCPLCRSYIIII